MRDNPKPFERYRHFKGNLYQVITLAKDSETMQELVVYQALYGDYQVYVRPLSMFMSRVDKAKYPDVRAEYRFEKESDNTAEEKTEHQEKQDSQERTEKQEYQEKQNSQKRPENQEHPEHQEHPDYESQIDPAVLEFLEAGTYEEKLRILVSVRSRITNEMINTMAVASDIEVLEGPVEKRYDQLKNCLLTLEKYECNRVR